MQNRLFDLQTDNHICILYCIYCFRSVLGDWRQLSPKIPCQSIGNNGHDYIRIVVCIGTAIFTQDTSPSTQKPTQRKSKQTLLNVFSSFEFCLGYREISVLCLFIRFSFVYFSTSPTATQLGIALRPHFDCDIQVKLQISKPIIKCF